MLATKLKNADEKRPSGNQGEKKLNWKNKKNADNGKKENKEGGRSRKMPRAQRMTRARRRGSLLVETRVTFALLLTPHLSSAVETEIDEHVSPIINVGV